ncbi:ATP-binding protein [Pseudomonas sp. LRF_L74]|uniref:ATP-binding protein n=1 Tax=Pseudomonas sp. LRF_L74 TaxID=3369422 RepID=UPI003F6019CF
MYERTRDGTRVLILASAADTSLGVLRDNGYEIGLCADLDGLADSLNEEAGVAVIAEEALTDDLSQLQRALQDQAPWSDIPLLILAARRDGQSREPESAWMRLPRIAASVIVLERPLGAMSLLSAVASAMRARQKQFLIRTQLIELAESRRALQASERELRLVADSLPVLIAFVDIEWRLRFVNRASREWLYRPALDLIGLSLEEVLGPPELQLCLPELEHALAGIASRQEVSWPYRDGSRREADVRYLPRYDEAGQVDGCHVLVLDVTEQRMAEEVLRGTAESLEQKVAERTAALNEEMANRALAEAALRQSQKMEAVGQLTGGIAHDFNNMLTGVIGALDIMKRRIASGRQDDLERFMDAAFASANRAAGLTQRLLAFSRRQSLDARAVDVTALLGSLEELIERTITEGIVMRSEYAADTPRAIIDANQLESAILNLAINARDAMPGGGELLLRTEVVELDEAYTSTRPDMRPGTYVVVTVADSGSGMPPDVLERAFDPFFTTKPVGQGTGLGLSMVYGFVRQSRGQVLIDTSPEAGTRVSLYLPAASHLDSV